MDLYQLLSNASEALRRGDASEAERLCSHVLSELSITGADQSDEALRQRADAYRILAGAARLKCNYDLVLANAEMAGELYRQIGDELLCNGIVMIKAQRLLDIGDHQGAMQLFTQAYTVAKHAGNLAQVARNECNIGNVHLRVGAYSEAFEMFRLLEQHAIELGDKSLQALAYGNQGLAHRHLGDPVSAITAIEKALQIDMQMNNVEGVARNKGNLANVHHEIGNLNQALALYDEALSLHRKQGNHRNVGVWLENLGVIQQALGNESIALEYFEQAHNVFHDIRAEYEEGQSQARIAGSLFKMGKHTEAIVLLQRSIEKAKHDGLDNTVMTLQANLGHMFTTLHRFTEAHKCLVQTIEGIEQQDAPSRLAMLYDYLGNLFSHKGNPDRSVSDALQWYRKSLEMYERMNVKRALLNVHFTIAELLQECEDWKGATAHLESARQIQSIIIKEDTHLQAQKTYYQQQIEQLKWEQETRRMQLNAKDTELQHVIDRLVSKNNLLRTIARSVDDTRQHMRPQGAEKIESVIEMIDKSIKDDVTYTTIDTLMLDVYSDFVNALQLRCPTVTQMELKVATLLNRQMASASIADVLCLSKRTIEVHRHNLRKKLGLKPSDDLYQVLRTI